MNKNFLQSRNLLTLAAASAAVSFVLVLVGIFYLAGMKSPTQGMNYGLTLEMFSNPVFVRFHLGAFAWLFISGFLTGIVTLLIIERRVKKKSAA